MSQNGPKNKAATDKKPIFVRGVKPSTKEWLQSKINEDAPSVPKVVKNIVEDAHRREKDQRKR